MKRFFERFFEDISPRDCPVFRSITAINIEEKYHQRIMMVLLSTNFDQTKLRFSYAVCFAALQKLMVSRKEFLMRYILPH